MNEVMTINVNELSNKKLAQNITVMVNSIKSMKMHTWAYARAIHDIVVNGDYKDDFDTVESFALAIGSTKAKVSKFKKAVTFCDRMKPYVTCINSLAVETVYRMSNVKDMTEADWECLGVDITSNSSWSEIEALLDEYLMNARVEEVEVEVEVEAEDNTSDVIGLLQEVKAVEDESGISNELEKRWVDLKATANRLLEYARDLEDGIMKNDLTIACIELDQLIVRERRSYNV